MYFYGFFQEDLVICEYCDQGVHYSCLSPPPEKRPKVWDCDDCLIARGKPPNNNVSYFVYQRASLLEEGRGECHGKAAYGA